MEKYDRAIPLIEGLIESRNYYINDISWLGICYVKIDSVDAAQKIITKLDSINNGASKYKIATMYAALDEKDLAVEYLLKAFDEDFAFELGRYDTDPELFPLHGHPGYEKLVKPKG